ncbi:MAG TPA: DUF4418 family protein [Symbiobacteriaceae bacterium]|jgi:hypothetical protein|nr:DUF4418 family protein [Symbiobacteriaceae bacterium]
MKFLNNNWRGLTVFALGVATVLVTIFFLDSCADAGHFVKTANGMDMHMGCTWTQRAVIGLGGLTAVFGLIMMAMKEAARGLSLAAFATGALVIATPLWLIPTCKNAMMTCNLSLKPGALVLGGLILVAGLAGGLRFARGEGAGQARLSA